MKLDSLEIEANDYDEKTETRKTNGKQQSLNVFSFTCDIDSPEKSNLLGSILATSNFDLQLEGQQPRKVKVKQIIDSFQKGQHEHHYEIQLEEYSESGEGVRSLIDAVRKAARLGIDVWDDFSSFRIPFSYEKLQHLTIEQLEKSNHKRIVDEYSKMKEGEKPIVLDKNYLAGHKQELSVENVSFLRNAQEFYRMAISASPETKPILYYYSLVSFFAFVSRTYLRFDHYAKAHGVVGNIVKSDEMSLEFRPEGFWPRIVDTLTVMGFNSTFSPVLVFEKGETIVLEKNVESSLAFRKNVKIKDLRKYSTEQYSKDLAKKYGADCNVNVDVISEVSNYLVDWLMLFCASTAARYNPLVWNEILRGETSSTISRIETAYALYPEFVDFIFIHLFRKNADTLHQEAELERTTT